MVHHQYSSHTSPMDNRTLPANNNYYCSSQTIPDPIPPPNKETLHRDLQTPASNSLPLQTNIDESNVTLRNRKITKDDISSPVVLTNNNTLTSHHQSSFKPHSIAKLNSTAQLPSMAASSNRSSRLSLYDSSGCSSESFLDEDMSETRHQQVKSNSFEGVITEGNHTETSHYGKTSRASSDERLDCRKKTIENTFLSNHLSSRNRSNSMDFKALVKENLTSNTPRQGYYEKNKSVIRDKISWRRSLVLDEPTSLKQYKPLFRGSDDLDASLVLDNPPKLPPKSKKGNKGSSENPRLHELRSQQKDIYKRRSLDLAGSSHTYLSDINKHFDSPTNPISKESHSLITVNSKAVPPHNQPVHLVNKLSLSKTKSYAADAPPVALPRTIYTAGTGIIPPPSANVMERSNTFVGLLSSRNNDDQISLSSIDSFGGGKNKEFKRSFKEKSSGSSRKGSIRGFFSRSSSNDGRESSKSSSPVPSFTDERKSIKLPKVN